MGRAAGRGLPVAAPGQAPAVGSQLPIVGFDLVLDFEDSYDVHFVGITGPSRPGAWSWWPCPWHDDAPSPDHGGAHDAPASPSAGNAPARHDGW